MQARLLSKPVSYAAVFTSRTVPRLGPRETDVLGNSARPFDHLGIRSDMARSTLADVNETLD